MKTQPIQVRVSPSEKQAFIDAASWIGISLSAWIRARLRRAAIKDLEDFGKLPAFLIEEDKLNDQT